MFLASCSGKGEFIPVPTPAPEPPSTTTNNSGAATGPAAAEPAAEDLTAPDAGVAAYEWGPVLCPRLPHPAHHEECPVADKWLPDAPAAKSNPVRGSSADLASIRACESHSNYSTDTGNGYYGAYQFHPGTWASVGGSGNPAHASPAEQDMRAQMMIDQGRRSEWPNC